MHALRTKILLAPIPKRLCIWAWKIRDHVLVSAAQRRAGNTDACGRFNIARRNNLNAVPVWIVFGTFNRFFFTNGSHFRNSLDLLQANSFAFVPTYIHGLFGFPFPPNPFSFPSSTRCQSAATKESVYVSFLSPLFHVVRPNYRRSPTSFQRGKITLIILRKFSSNLEVTVYAQRCREISLFDSNYFSNKSKFIFG